jgi:hypothetical protein
MKKIISLLLAICYTININAQTICKDVLDKYSPSIVAKLYEIVKYTPLKDSLQLAIANQFQNADKELVEAIKQGADIKYIERKQINSQLSFNKIMGKEMVNYSSKKSTEVAYIFSGGESRYVYETYNLDTSLNTKIRNLAFNKYKRMYQVFLLYNFDKESAVQKITEASKYYDSIYYTIYPTLHSGKYIENYIATVKKIKPTIADSIIKKIQNAFFVSTIKTPYIDCGQTMLDVMQHIYPDTAITAYFYKPVIERQSKFLSSAQKNELINKQHVSKTAYDTIYNLVQKKNSQQVLLEYTYGANSKWRDSVINVSNKYYDSSITALLFRNGSLLSTSQFTIALKYKSFLTLRETLVDTLLFHAMYLDKLQDSSKQKDPFAKTDFKAYEAKWLNQLLTEEQYTKLLTIKNSSAAQLDAKEDWEDMETWKITKDFNKEETIKTLFKYYIAKWIIYYRLANDKLKQEANLRSLKETQPKALKMLSAAKKLPNPVNDNTNLQLKW